MLRAELEHIRGEAVVGDVVEGARKLGLSALCLSGGGIRSASFCLGVLQALAEAGLLRKFDYLSTVSGGGYIGGWLQQLIREKSLANTAPTAEERVARAEEELKQPAAAALRRLRDHTNFLTPHGGIASADVWAGVALYLRNLGLNWLVLLPVFLVAALAPIFHRTLIWWVGQSEAAAVAALLLASLALGLGVCWSCIWLPSHRARASGGATQAAAEERAQAQARWRWAIVVAVLAWTALVPVFGQFLMDRGGMAPFGGWGWFAGTTWFMDGFRSLGMWVLPGIYFLTMLGGYIAAAVGQRRADAKAGNEAAAWQLYCDNIYRWMIASAGASAVLMILLRLLWSGHKWLVDHNGVADILTLASPVALLAVLLSQTTFYMGIRKRALRADLDREWLARLNGVILGIGVGWTLFAASCLVIAKLTLREPEGGGAELDAINTIVAGMGAALSGLGASWLGGQVTSQVRSIASASARPGMTKWLAMQVLPIVFIVALFGFMGTLLQVGLGFAQEVIEKWLGWQTATWTGCESGQAGTALDVWSMALLCDGAADPWAAPQLGSWWVTGLPILLQAILAVMLGWVMWRYMGFINVNRFSMHAVYRNRLVRAFLGTPRGRRQPEPFTGFDEGDDPRLINFQSGGGKGQRLFPVLNATLNVTDGGRGAWAERKAMAFTATPLFCGAADLREVNDQAEGAFVPTWCFAGKENRNSRVGENEGTRLGSMMTVSGAAASPHWGYNSSPAMAFLMTLFNVRLGAWYPNPAAVDGQIGVDDDIQLAKPRNSLWALLGELTGRARADSQAIYLSDGGHFDNLGVYEMIRRRCARILVVDATADPECGFFDLGMMIRKAEIDLKVKIDIDTSHIAARTAMREDTALARKMRGIACGTICYLDDNGKPVGDQGQIIYIKPSLLPGAPAALHAYGKDSTDFPHESTGDQWFSESQFESYRTLGKYQAGMFLGRGNGTVAADLAEAFQAARDLVGEPASAAPPQATP